MFNWLGEDILPHSSNLMLLLAMITADLATYLTRILPYIFLKKHTKNKTLIFLQHNMGLFIMVVLIFYSLGVMEKKEPLFLGCYLFSFN